MNFFRMHSKHLESPGNCPFRRYHERTALWDHHTAVWAHLRQSGMTKLADSGRKSLNNLKVSELRAFLVARNAFIGNLMKAILVEN